MALFYWHQEDSTFSFSTVFRSTQSLGFFVSLGLHLLAFMAAGAVFVVPQFAVETGVTSMEVTLASMPQRRSVVPDTPKAQPVFVPEVSTQVPVEEKVEKAVSASVQEVVSTDVSNVSERQTTSLYDSISMPVASGKGATMEATPDYLKNTPPVYPESARKHGIQGEVLLRVWVSATGKAQKVVLKKSSGYSLLDSAALKSVKQWTFKPAIFASIPVESEVIVPVKFQLKTR